MKCTRPTKFQSDGVLVRCGQCMPCRITRRTEWVTKLVLEARTWNNNVVFVTLTYSPKNLPNTQWFPSGEIIKKHAQDFMKRFRYNYQYEHGETEIRYFLVGEYGDKSSRAHYHAIIYNVDAFKAEEHVKKAWTLGLTQTQPLKGNEALTYVCGYTIKKMTNIKDFPDGQTPEFILQSRKPALGAYALDSIAQKLKKRGLIVTTHLTGLEKWHLYNDGHLNNEPEFNGWFKIGQKNYCLDRHLMCKLGEILLPKYDNLAQSIDTRYLLTPKKFKVKKDIMHDMSKFGHFKNMMDGTLYETQKKADKVSRQYKDRKKI